MSKQAPLTRHDPLNGKAIIGDSLSILPVKGMGKFLLERSNIVPDGAIKPVGAVLGLDMPMQVCRMARQGGGEGIVICISPNKWLFLCDETQIKQHMGKVESVVTANKLGTIAITQVTDQYAFLEVGQANARQLLEKGCSLDLHPDVFKTDHSASTLLAQADIVLWRSGDSDYHLVFDVSLCNYLWHWLEGAAAEFI